MIRLAAPSLAAALAILGAAGPARAEGPPTVFAKPPAIEASGVRLRWDAVEGPPYWVSGPRPGFAPGWGPHAIRLEPGERVTILVPGSSLLRIHAADGERAAGLEAWASDGFGLEIAVPVLRSSDPHAFFVHTGSHAPRRVALGLPGPSRERERERERIEAATDGLEVSLFLSRTEAYPVASLHRTLLALPGKPVGVSSSPLLPGDRHWRVEGSSIEPFIIEGPARLALVTRFEAPRGEPAAVQGYRLRVIIDEAERLFDFETGIDPAEEWLVDGAPALLGSRRTAWFEVPGGEHRVSLRSSAPLLVRLLRASGKDTLLASLPGDDIVHGRTGAAATPWEDFFGRGAPSPSRLAFPGDGRGAGEAIVPTPADIAALFRDIRKPDSALLAAMFCRDLALRAGLPPETRACALDAFRRHARWRSIAPAEKPIPSPQAFSWFAARRLAMPGDDPESTVLDEHLGEALEGFSPGFFIDLPPDRESALVYRLPERIAPSILRLAVDRSRARDRSDLLVEIDDGPPARLRFDPARAAPVDAAAPLRADAGLAALRELFPRFAPSTFSGPFGAFRTPAPIVDATAAEIPLPREATRIRVWCDGPPPRAALQYLVEEPRAPTDAERAAALRALGLESRGSSPLLAALDAWSRGVGPGRGEAVSGRDESLSELVSAYAPLFRFLVDAREGFVAGGSSSSPRGAADIGPAPASPARAAETLEKSGDWLPALEARALGVDARSPDDRRVARLGVVRALEGLGERFLARAQLRGISLDAGDESLRHDAFEMLLEHERASEDPGAVVGPLAWAALDRGDPEVVRLLAEALADDGAHAMALAAAAGLPPEERPLEVVLRAAASLRRWTVFDEALDALPDLDAWHYWKGVREACAWNTDAALRNLASGGTRGRELERVIRRALAIREGLASDDFGRRARSVLSWEDWQAAYPGPRRWTEDPALVLDHAGFAPCRSMARRLIERFHVARPSRPLVLEAAGPATIRIEARPLHPSAAAIDGWLEVREDGLLRVLPITANVAASGVEVSGIDGARPGRKVIADVRIGPGIRRLEVLAPGMDILARVLVEEPEIPMGILPPLSPFTLRRALRTSGEDPLSGRDAAGSAVLVRHGASKGIPLVPLDALDAPAPWRATDMDPVLAARMALRGGGDPSAPELRAPLAEIGSGACPGVRAEEALVARMRLGEDADAPSLPGLPAGVLEAALLAKGRASDIIRIPPGPAPQDLRRRLAILTYLAESDPAHGRSARAAGESIYRRHQRVPGIGGLFLRLARGTDWQSIASVRDSAGMRRVAVPPSSAEAPELRVRKALLPPFRSDERLVAGGNRLGLALATGRPIVLEIELRLDTVEFLPREPVAALYQLDDGKPREVRLGPEEDTRKVELLVPEGDHAVRLWIEEPVANHFLRVRVREASPEPPASAGEAEAAGAGAGEVPWSEAGEKRLYFLATRERPVRAVIEGPAWIRADELRDGSTYTTYREVPEGFHELSFVPAEGRDEALFRIFERAETAPERAPRPVESREPIPAPEPPLAALEERPGTPEILVSDAFHLGGHEDGTLSLELSGRRVRLFDEDEGAPGANQYLQLEGAHRLFDAPSTWFETALLARAHERGGPALGIREEILHEPRWFPAALRLAATGFIQWPDGGSAEFDGPVETSATLRGSMSRRFGLGLKAYHLPSVAVFGRVLGLDDADGYRPGDIDPDVFTEYKDDHRHGLVLSEMAGWRPWLDSELWVRGSVTTNEDMNPVDPDHVAAIVGWKQYVEGFQLDVHFQATQFFEDADRSDRRLRQVIGLAVYHDLWASPTDRLEAGCEILQDITEGETSGQVFLAWHWGRGRGYRDFRPGAIDFFPLRAARIPLDPENRIEEAR